MGDSQYQACVKNGLVDNVVVCSDEFAATVTLSGEYDALINITALSPRPEIGYSYDGANFSPPLGE
jgi:hypothetical protein